jgi:phosphoglycolate phosphatase
VGDANLVRRVRPRILKAFSRLIVFDLDGTLVDSRRDIADSANVLLQRAGTSPLPEETIGRMVGEGAATFVRRAFEAAAVPQPHDALEQFLQIYATRLLVHTRPYPGIPELLGRLEASFGLAVLTNKPIRSTRDILDGLQLSRFFTREAVIGGDGSLGRKPSTEGLQRLMDQSGSTPADTVLVGDSLIDWRTAEAAGVKICLARYGFGFESIPDDVARSACVIDAPLDLLQLVRK